MIANNFDYYYYAVEPTESHGRKIVDFSVPRFHQLNGYIDQIIQFPAIVEPMQMAEQYLQMARLGPSDIVLDLGAYSGFTSILFDQAVGDTGRVVAVEADLDNIGCIGRNLAVYNQRSGRTIDVLHAAVWKEDGEILFSSEGNMGSSVTAIVGTLRSNTVNVPAVTLETIAHMFGLERIDFIKCDIEGAEAVIFDQPCFFKRFRPRIVMEVHNVRGKLTTRRCRAALARFGYTCREVPQTGSDLPLLDCLPSLWSGSAKRYS